MRTIGVLMLCLIVAATAKAQRKKVWSFGPEIGVNYSRYGLDANANERMSGICGGLFLTYSVINTFALTGKVLYAEKGSITGTREETLKYVEVPITGRFFLTKRGRFRPNFFFGPYMGYLRGVSRKTGPSDPVKLINYQDTYHKYDLGVTGGLGLNYRILEHTRLLLDGRYSHGLTDLTKAPGEINNETITITFGISFGI